MMYTLEYGKVVFQERKIIHVLRSIGNELAIWEVQEIGKKMEDRLLSRHGEQAPAVVIVQERTDKTPRLFGDPYAVSRVRDAMFVSSSIKWSSIDLA
jgi:hypothetical protein